MDQQVWGWIGQHLWEIVLFLSVFIQISPIKIDPWSKLFKWIGKVMTAETRNDINNLTEIVTEQQETIDENEKDRIRWEVLDFANSCRNGRKHTKDEFDHIITLVKKYEKLLAKTDDENGVFELEYKYILKLYAKCQEENTFL